LKQLARVEIGVTFGAETEDSPFQQQYLGEHGYREDDVDEDGSGSASDTISGT
jgi:hypothetical protein